MNLKIFRKYTWLVLPVLLLIIWEYTAIKMDNTLILPKFTQVIIILKEPFKNLLSIGSLYHNLLMSLLRVFLGYTFACLFAIPLGILIGFSRNIRAFLMPFLNLFRPIAPLAWVPLVLAWMGISSVASFLRIDSGTAYIIFSNIKLAMIFIIFIGGFFPILTNTIYGVTTVKKTLIDSALVMGATKKDIVLKVILPGAFPSIVTGLRVGLGISWMCLVSAEMLPGSLAGIGYLIMHAYTIARTDVVIAGIIVISIVGAIIDRGFEFIENKYYKWQNLER